jgi:hypothetical protein
MSWYSYGPSLYISSDVIFDKSGFCFSNPHSSAGARLRSEILLLSQHLLNPCLPTNGGEILDHHVTNVSNPGTTNSAQSFVQVPAETHAIRAEAAAIEIREDSGAARVISGVIAPGIGEVDAGTAHAESSSGLEATDGDGAHSVGEPHAVAASESTPSPLDQSHQATTTCWGHQEFNIAFCTASQTSIGWVTLIFWFRGHMLYVWKDYQVYFHTQQMTPLFDFWAKCYAHFSGRCTSYYWAEWDYKQDSAILPQMQPFTCF